MQTVDSDEDSHVTNTFTQHVRGVARERFGNFATAAGVWTRANAFKAITKIPQPSAFMGLPRGIDDEIGAGIQHHSRTVGKMLRWQTPEHFLATAPVGVTGAIKNGTAVGRRSLTPFVGLLPILFP
jgi:hypothetical protein